jgi:ferredoxin/coenzyme F420-reducing hydrogenase delta subunit
VWIAALALVVVLCFVPRMTRPRLHALPAPAEVNERTCTGCEQCVKDCPYEAIEMIGRTDREGFVAQVKTDLCTSCGICIASCPPMAISAFGMSGRDQLADVRAFLARERPTSRDVVMVGCAWSAARRIAEQNDARFFPVSCVGSLHSSSVEFLLRGGAGGVLVVGCAEHDGRTREGVTWAEQRMFEGRKADLKERVDKSRVRLVQASLGEGVALHDAARIFAEEIAALAADDAEVPDLVAACKAGRIQELS